MVGVPGRSKACHTCRKRRIACDLQVPHCAQCIKSKRKCEGYHRERIFIQQSGHPGRESQSNPLRDASTSQPQNTWQATDLAKVTLRSLKRVVPNAKRPTLLPLEHHIPGHAAVQQQLLSTFIRNWAPVACRDSQYICLKDDTPWITALPSMPNLTKALNVAILALCTANIGRLNNDSVLIHESRKLYCRGLQEMQRALWDPVLMHSDHTLAACIILSMYEVFECPGGDSIGWITHADGCARIVESRGPHAHNSPFSHRLFLSLRLTLIVQAMATNRPTFLATPEWSTLPWKGLPRTPRDQMFDLLAEGANILADANQLSAMDPTLVGPALIGIANRCWKLDHSAQAIYTLLEKSTLGPLYWPQISTQANHADDLDGEKVFPIAFYFPNLTTAHTCMVYWALSSILWQGLSSLYKAMRDLSFDLSQLPALEYRVDLLPPVRNICQSIEYFWRAEMGMAGLSATTWPLQVAADILKDKPNMEREQIWIKASLRGVYDRGCRVAKCGVDGDGVQEFRDDTGEMLKAIS